MWLRHCEDEAMARASVGVVAEGMHALTVARTAMKAERIESNTIARLERDSAGARPVVRTGVCLAISEPDVPLLRGVPAQMGTTD